MSRDRTLYGIIAEVVRRETRFLRHYEGEVLNNDDSQGKGRVLCAVPALGRVTQAEGLWCWPRYAGHRQSTPAVGEPVEVYFMGGRIERPVYLGGLAELKSAALSAFEDQDSHVLFEDPGGGATLAYDAGAQELEVAVAAKLAVLTDLLEIGSGSESFVLGDSLKAYLDGLKAYVDAHVHSGVTTGGGTSGPPGAPSPVIPTVLSSKIKGE